MQNIAEYLAVLELVEKLTPTARRAFVLQELRVALL